MMNEVADVAKAVTPHQIYLVCDALTGQDAVNSAKQFNESVISASSANCQLSPVGFGPNFKNCPIIIIKPAN